MRAWTPKPSDRSTGAGWQRPGGGVTTSEAGAREPSRVMKPSERFGTRFAPTVLRRIQGRDHLRADQLDRAHRGVVVHLRLVALQQQVPDPKLALEVVEAFGQVVRRAGHDQVVGDLLLV